jgi:outer membrane receptor protein involved in Fe transport
VVGGFFQDEIRVRPDLTLSAGVRFDWQNFFHDNNNVSPRLAFAYALGKNRKTVFAGRHGTLL